MLSDLHFTYTDSDPIPWYVILPVVAAFVVAIWFVGRRNRSAAKLITIVLVLTVLGSTAMSAILPLAFG